MAISVLTGHLTAREKQIIAQMIDRGMDAAKSARITVRLTREGNVWTAATSRVESDDWGRRKVRTDRATFTTREVART
jgi:hypothetical protein